MKSRLTRLSECSELLRLFEERGYTSDRKYTFLKDMLLLLEREKPLSPRRRRWLDDIISKGEDNFPKPKNLERYEKIVALAEHHREASKTVMLEFSVKVRNGWDLSDKQEAFLAKLIEEAEHIKENGHWEPNSDELVLLQNATKICRSKNSVWLSHQAGLCKAFANAKKFLNKEAEYIDRWSYNKITNKFKKDLSELQSPKHIQGECRFNKVTKSVIIITGMPHVDDSGFIAYPVLEGSDFSSVRSSNILKRSPK